MSSFHNRMAPALAALLIALPLHAQTAAKDWRPDVDVLLHAIDSIRPSPYQTISRDSLQRVAERLRVALPRMSDAERVAGFAHIVALLHDGHSRLGHVQLINHGRPILSRLSIAGFDRIYPVEFEFFSDGLYVVACGAGGEKLLGGHVVSLAGRPASDAGKRLADFISYDNEQWLFYLLPAYLRHPGYLFAAGVIARPEAPLTIEVEKAGIKTGATLLPVNADSVQWQSARDVVQAEDGASYSMRALSDSVLYVRLRQIQSDSAFPINAFADRMASTMGSMGLSSVIIDIRRNGGGNGYLNQPLMLALLREKRLQRRGSVRVLTDRGTFSAAIMLAAAIEQNLFAAFIGEATGSPPNQMGDPAHVTLPSSGLLVRISSLYWQSSDPRDHRLAIMPDVAVAPSYDDWLHGRDPVLAAALALDTTRIEWLQQPNTNWQRPAQQPERFAIAVRW